jgi:hypothetical protein
MYETLDDLLQEITRHLFQYIEHGDLTDAQVVVTLDTFKMAMGEYNRLVTEGKVPEERQYRQDSAKAIDMMNEVLGTEL